MGRVPRVHSTPCRRLPRCRDGHAGYGNSAPVPGPQTIETYARGAWELLDTLGVDRVTVIGHHTGAAVALEMAASRPERVHAAVLSSCPWTDRNYREGHSGPGGIDCVDRAADGSHLTRLWEMRRPYYPEPGTALLDRFIRDALAYRRSGGGAQSLRPLRHGGESRFGDCAGFADRRAEGSLLDA